jgi:hypothetical protein
MTQHQTTSAPTNKLKGWQEFRKGKHILLYVTILRFKERT